MRKLFKNKNKKGFAMAELLAVCVVLLFIFSILFSNYLPLVAEYENRLSYNDVTAQYAAHYIRKIYNEALKDDELKGQFEDLTDGKTGYKTIYNEKDKNNELLGHIDAVKNNPNISWHGKEDAKKEEVNEVIKEYGIEEIIITRYKLNDPKDKDTDSKYVKGTYEKSNGDLYKYINYLPNYENSIYTGKKVNENGDEQLYRIILKTKDFGYATTPIFSDYKTPGSCFKTEKIPNTSNELKITEYLYNEENGCGNIVTISPNSIKSSNGLTGVITAIGDGVFANNEDNSNPAYKVTEVNLSVYVDSIGDNAFKGSELNKLPVLDKVESIGTYAFANTKMEVVDLSSYPSSSTIGDYAFANNENLTKVALPDYNIYSQGTTLSVGLFAKSGTKTDNGIAVTIPGGMTEIGAKMFNLAKISSINLKYGVEIIGNQAFSQRPDETTPTGNEISKNYSSVTIPSSVKSIGESSFDMLGIAILSLNVGNNPLEIKANAFKNNKISSLTIPSRVTSIGANAFESSQIKSLTFDVSDSSWLVSIGSCAFGTNEIQSLELPDSIKSIGNKAFESNKSLESVKLPKNEEYTIISNGLFQGGNSFVSIIIPNNVKIIDESAFNPGFNPSKLEIVTFEENSLLTTINGTAFANNDNLKEFTIPESVTTIKNKAFASCDNLVTVTNYSNEIIDKLYSNGCNIFFRNSSNDSCSSSINEDRSIIEVSYTSGIAITINNINVGGATNE